MSAGLMQQMSPWMTWPTFSSTVIFLSNAATFSSRAASFSKGHFGEGQISGCTAAGSSALAATAGLSLEASLHPYINRMGASESATAAPVFRTTDREGDIEKLLFLGADSLCCLSAKFDRWRAVI